MTRPTPKFAAPPVIETVLGVEFDPLPGWDIPHFGLFWQSVRDKYQKYSVVPPLNSQLEKFDDETRVKELISLSDKPEVRCWYFNNEDTWLMQAQNNRFLHNWRKRDDVYPHYEQVKEQFFLAWDKFEQFLAQENLGAPVLRQCEVTYINHIEQLDNWDWSALSRIFPNWRDNSESAYLSTPEAVVLQTSYRLPENKGRLRIVMQPAIRHADLKRIIQLELTARVMTTSSKEALSASLDIGHEWVVNGFADFTSSEMHARWERKQ